MVVNGQPAENQKNVGTTEIESKISKIALPNSQQRMLYLITKYKINPINGNSVGLQFGVHKINKKINLLPDSRDLTK